MWIVHYCCPSLPPHDDWQADSQLKNNGSLVPCAIRERHKETMPSRVNVLVGQVLLGLIDLEMFMLLDTSLWYNGKLDGQCNALINGNRKFYFSYLFNMVNKPVGASTNVEG